MPAGNDVGDLVEDWPENLHPHLQQFMDYWSNLRGNGATPPRRADIHPADISEILPGFAIFERVAKAGKGTRYRYRLVGTAHYAANNDTDLTGKFLDEVYSGPLINHVYETYDRIIESGAPHYWRGPVPMESKIFRSFERLIAPLLDENGEATMLAGVWVWHT